MNMITVEESLIKACQERDRRAQHELYRACYSFLMGICIRYVRNREDAEELLNQSFLKVLTNLDKYRPEVPFALWIRRIMINTVIDDFRRKQKDKEAVSYVDFDEKPDEYNAVAINDYVSKMNVEVLQSLIDKLPPMSRSVFNLFVVDGYGHKEIASLLGMSEGTSKWHLNFSRNKLKEWIAIHIPEFKQVAS